MAKSSSTPSKAVVKADPAVLQFQRLAKAFLTSAPPGHHESVVPSTLCSFDRQYASGYRQTISLLQAGDQKFVQTISGNDKYLPVSLRSVSMKRGRELVEDDDEDAGMTLSSDDESVTVSSSKKRSDRSKKKDKGKETPQKKSRSSRHSNSLFTPDGHESDPSPRLGPRAPRKTRSHHHTRRKTTSALDESVDYDAEDDNGEATETESTATTAASVLGSVRRSLRQREATAGSSGPSSRRSAERQIKLELTEDDLSSLCGGLENIEVQSSIDAESEYGGTPAPSLRSGSVRV